MCIDQLTIATTNIHAHESTLVMKTLKLLPVHTAHHFAGRQVTSNSHSHLSFRQFVFQLFALIKIYITFPLSIIFLIALEQGTGFKCLSKGQNDRDTVKVFSKKYYHSCASLGTTL